MAAAGQSSKIAALWKRGWHEIPEIMASTAVALLGIPIGCYGLYDYIKNDGNNKRYKIAYTVYRPDDPRAQKIKPSGSD